MTVSTKFDEAKNLVIHHFSESVTLQLFLTTIENTINNPGYKAGMNTICICAEGTIIDITAEETRKVSEYARKKFDRNGVSYKLALVASDDLAYGMNRVYEGWSNDRPIVINTFREVEQAFNWIDE